MPPESECFGLFFSRNILTYIFNICLLITAHDL